MPEVLLNPSAASLGRVNAILAGRGKHYDVRGFAGPLSIKSVIRGLATWETEAGRFELAPGSALILNDGEEYALTIDALQPVETFCVFFERGFVEDAYRAATTSSAALLDTPPARPVTFHERLHFGSGSSRVASRGGRADSRLATRDSPGPALLGALTAARTTLTNDLPLSLYPLASLLVRAQCDVDARAARLPVLRASTREELRRRLDVATSFLHASLDQPVTIADAASAACLSPFHFHRLFTAFHGETPHRYLTRLRLDHAAALLHGTGTPVADVAASCGFESVGSFTTLFARRFGAPPARFRKNREDAAQAADAQSPA